MLPRRRRLAVLLFRWRRQGRPDTFVLGFYLLLAGAIRFAIEFVRVNERVVGIFSVAHLASLSAITIGIALLLKSRHLLWMKQRLA